MLKTKMTELLQIDYPIIQAPMAGGVTSTALVSATSQHGALGMIAAGYMTESALREQVRAMKKRTEKPFGINVFIPSKKEMDATSIQQTKKRLHPYYQKYNIDKDTIHITSYSEQLAIYEKHIQIILHEAVPVVSFTFGIPDKTTIDRLKRNGTVIMGTAENVDEALRLEKSGMDMIVLQGSEAGGHRGGCREQSTNGTIGLMALVPQAAKVLSVPVIAAGGIMNGKGLVAASALGAAGVQMGTAFLLTKESNAHPLHKQAIINSQAEHTVITNTFSGKPARGVSNRFMEEMTPYKNTLPPYPVMNQLTQPIRKAAKQDNNHEWMSLWSGQGTQLGNIQTVQELIEATIQESTALLEQIRKDGTYDT